MYVKLANLDQALLDCILEINKFSLDLSTEKFDQAAFDLIHELIPFDSGAVGSAALVNGGLVWVGMALRNLDQQFLDLINQYGQLDDSNLQAAFNPGVTLMRCAKDAHPILRREVLDKYPVYHSMVTGIVDRRGGVFQAMSINRKESSQPFTKQEQQAKQLLMPHFQEAYAQNRLQRAIDILDGGVRASYAVVSSNLQGAIIAISAAATTYLSKAFQAWPGGFMPNELIEAVAPLARMENARVFMSEHLVVKAIKSKEQIVWQLRVPTLVDKLSVRELQVANAYASGLSHKEIAKQLDLSPSTVSNQLTSVYSKLAIDNKAGLATLLRDFA